MSNLTKIIKINKNNVPYNWNNIKVKLVRGDPYTGSEVIIESNQIKKSVSSLLYNTFISSYLKNPIINNGVLNWDLPLKITIPERNYTGTYNDSVEDSLVFSYDQYLFIRLPYDDNEKKSFTKCEVYPSDVTDLNLDNSIFYIDFSDSNNNIGENDLLLVVSLGSDIKIDYTLIHNSIDGFEHSEVAISPNEISSNLYTPKSVIESHTDITNLNINKLEVIDDRLVSHYLGTITETEDNFLLTEDKNYIILEPITSPENYLLISDNNSYSYFGYKIYDIIDNTITIEDVIYDLTINDDGTAVAIPRVGGLNNINGIVSGNEFGVGNAPLAQKIPPTNTYNVDNNKVTIYNVTYDVVYNNDGTVTLNNIFYTPVNGYIFNNKFSILSTDILPTFEGMTDDLIYPI